MELFSKLFALFATIAVPVGAGIWLSVRKKGYMVPVLLGAATFLAFQVFTRIQVLGLLNTTAWYSMFAMTQPVLWALFLGATAALFEEGGRYVVMTLFMKKKRRVSDGIAFGVGHGGIEAVVIVGIGLAYAVAAGNYMPVLETFLGGAERLLTMVFHIGLSVMVLRSVSRRRPFWLLLAFILHTAVDMGAVLMGQAGIAPIWIEAAILPFVAAVLIYTIVEYKKSEGGEIK